MLANFYGYSLGNQSRKSLYLITKFLEELLALSSWIDFGINCYIGVRKWKATEKCSKNTVVPPNSQLIGPS